MLAVLSDTEYLQKGNENIVVDSLSVVMPVYLMKNGL